jgi:spore germination cell wall hydrolase CwlJ-like protein
MKKFFETALIIGLPVILGSTGYALHTSAAVASPAPLQVSEKHVQTIDDKTKSVVLGVIDDITKIVDKSKNKKDITCLAENIYYESRNQSYLGRFAVAHVTLNRSKNQNSSTCKVVYKRSGNGCQFSWVCQLKNKHRNYAEKIAWKESLAIAYASINNMIEDPTHGATYYYNPKKAHPSWAKKFQEVAFIGDHRFLKE